MVKLLHAADLHLDSPFAGLEPEEALARRRLQRGLPLALARLARAEGCSLLLLAGDVFDGARVTPETVEALQTAFEEAALPVLIAPGNHDPYVPGSPWVQAAWPGNVHIFTGGWTGMALPDLGCRIWGAAFRGGEAHGLLGTAPRAEGYLEIGLLHGELAAAGPYNPMAEADVANSGLAYLALGHIHRPRLPAAVGGTWVGWPGVTLGRGFDEPGDHGTLVVTVDETGCTGRLRVLPGPRYHLCSVRAGTMPDLPEDCQGDYIRLEVTGEGGPADCEALERALAGRCRSLRVIDRTVPPADLWAEAGTGSLRGLALERLLAAHAAGDPSAAAAARYLIAALEGRDAPWS